MYKSKVKISPLVQGDKAVPWNAYTDGYAMRFPNYNLYWAAETRYAKISDVMTNNLSNCEDMSMLLTILQRTNQEIKMTNFSKYVLL